MSEQLKHIFDSSACLSKRQLKDYVNGIMSREECYAVEHHINACFLCSEALEGMAQTENALVVADELNAGFLKDHFSLINPQIHLNSIAPSVHSQTISRPLKNRGKVQFLKPSAIAAALILGLGILWYREFSEDHNAAPQIAKETIAKAALPKPQNVVERTALLSETENTTLPKQASDGIDENINTSEVASNNKSNEQKPQTLLIADPKAGSEVVTDTVQNEKSAEPVKNENPKAISVIAPATPAKADGQALNNETIVRSKPVAQPQNADSEITKEKATDNAISSADALYESEKYSAALSAYKKQMNASGSKGQQYAALQAARCYINLSQNDKAIKLLQSIADNADGSYRRQAKRLLKDLEKISEK